MVCSLLFACSDFHPEIWHFFTPSLLYFTWFSLILSSLLIFIYLTTTTSLTPPTTPTPTPPTTPTATVITMIQNVEKQIRNEVQESLVLAKAGKPLADEDLTKV